MATLDWTCDTVDGVTLVELVVTGETAQQVRIESNLTPVWPPRQHGQAVAGWDGAAFEGSLDAEDPLVVGYASPAQAVEPPAELSTRPPTDDDEIDPQDVIQALGDGTPPRDVVPSHGPAASEELTGATESPNRKIPTDGAKQRRQTESERSTDIPDPGDESPTALPPAVEAYFAALEHRLGAAERLAEAETVEQACEAVSAAGGIGAVEGLDSQLSADQRRLENLRRRQQALVGRLDGVEIPVERLDRVT
jgi:hypothetical protein